MLQPMMKRSPEESINAFGQAPPHVVLETGDNFGAVFIMLFTFHVFHVISFIFGSIVLQSTQSY